MGKGDISSRKGKIRRGTSGKTRQKRKIVAVKKTVKK
ncbi:MAG: 30S ribosomal protein THX [Candidatus Delongbacteria bacterium]|nr:30S ribosomal protein THX [Candidatus Delongbacteria bacterium]